MVAPPSDSRGCLPLVAAQAGGGGETSCSSRNGSSPLLARSAKQGGGRAISASKRPRRNRRRRATRFRWRDCPGRECVPLRRDHSGTVLTGRGSKGVAPQRGWHPSQRPHLRKVGHGSPRNSIANTRPTETVVGALQSHVYLRHSATTCGLELAHAPQLANTHPFDCHCP